MSKPHPPRPAGCTCASSDVVDDDCELVQHLRRQYAGTHREQDRQLPEQTGTTQV